MKCHTVLFIAKGANKTFVDKCREKFSAANLPLLVAGLSKTITSNEEDITIDTDKLIKDIPTSSPSHLLVFPGDKNCISALMVDPRIHVHINTTIENNGLIAAARNAEMQTRKSGIPTTAKQNFIPQGVDDDETFINNLIDQVLVN